MRESRTKNQELRHLVSFIAFLCLFSLVAGTSWAARFVDNGDGTVTDTQTGLMWQQADDGTVRNWADAVAYCESLVLPSSGGYSDWRAPRIDELETIINYATYNPASFDPPFDTRSNTYWSSSTYAFYPVNAWSVYFGNGDADWVNKTDDGYVRCVRGGPFWPFDPSTDLQTPAGKPNVVLDTYWGYMWQKGDSGDTPKTWADANAYCDALDLDGYTDWRLPEIEALVTIVNYTTYGPALSTIFDPRRSYYYWSSSTSAYYPDHAWFVNFVSGTAYWDVKTYYGYVRCVHGGPGSLVTLTLNKSGSGTGRVTSLPSGIDCGTSCPSQTANFAQLTQLTLTAQADPGSTFMGWSGGGCSGTGPCELTIGTDPVTVTAQWATRFVDNGDGTVTDTQTGLMWQRADDGTVRNWADAVAYCESLVLPSSGGYSDWRAPRIDELETIINYATYNPASYDPPFITSSTSVYWSSSTSAPYDYAWYVYFNDGEATWMDKTYGNYVRCVRGGPFWPFDPSTDLQTPIGKPDTVLDTYWGYMWQKGDSGDTQLNWEDANAYCNDLELDGYSDWRLPEIEALLTIVNYTTYDPALSTIFDPRRSFDYWSSTQAHSPDSAWYVGFWAGQLVPGDKTYGRYVRCVRGGPGFFTPALAVDFDAAGLWLYRNAGWSQLTSISPDRMAGYGNKLAGNFSGYGLYQYDGANWTQLTANDSVENIVGVSNGFYADYGSLGLWKYNGGWTQLSSANPDKMTANGDKLLATFSGFGLYQYDGTTWTQLTPNSSVDSMLGISGKDYADYGSLGLWKYDEGWTQLSQADPDKMQAYDGKLLANFASYGLYQYDGTAWTQLTANDSVEDLIAVSGNLYADYGTLGLWKYNGTWTQISSADANRLGSYDEKLVANFPAYGLYEYDGTTWTFLTGNSGATDIVGVVLP